MRIAISQPEHFPYLGFFQKMLCCDLFVILDSVQFSGPRSFQNRNKFMCNGKSQWFTVPVEKGSYFKLIKDVKVAPDYGWRRKLIRTLDQNFPGFDYTSIYNHEYLEDINIDSILLCRKMLNINTPIIKSSEIDVTGHKEELIYNICKYFNADTYISGQGAKAYMEKADFKDVKVKYINPVVRTMDSTLALIYNSKVLEEAKNDCKTFMEMLKNDF